MRAVLPIVVSFLTAPCDAAHRRRPREFTTSQDPELDVVIAWYDADINWTTDICCDESTRRFCVLYDKGFTFHADHDYPSCGTPNREIARVSLNNVLDSREGHSFLFHIIDNYDALPEWTIFAQDDPFDHSPRFEELVREFDLRQQPAVVCLTCQYMPPEEELSSLNWVTPGKCDGDGTPAFYKISPDTLQFVKGPPDDGISFLLPKYKKYRQLPDETQVVEHFLSLAGEGPIRKKQLDFCYAGILAVHRDLIRGRSKQFYQRLMSAFVVGDWNGTDSRADVNSGYIIERLWSYFFTTREKHIEPKPQTAVLTWPEIEAMELRNATSDSEYTEVSDSSEDSEDETILVSEGTMVLGKIGEAGVLPEVRLPGAPRERLALDLPAAPLEESLRVALQSDSDADEQTPSAAEARPDVQQENLQEKKATFLEQTVVPPEHFDSRGLAEEMPHLFRSRKYRTAEIAEVNKSALFEAKAHSGLGAAPLSWPPVDDRFFGLNVTFANLFAKGGAFANLFAKSGAASVGAGSGSAILAAILFIFI